MRLGLEMISGFGMPPVEFVELAADLGCQHISTGLTSFDFGICDYPAFSLRDDASLRTEMKAVMRDRGVSISLAEGFTVRPGGDVRDFAADLDIFAELGAERINTVSMDPDLSRTCAQIAVLAELANERGLRITTEFAPGLTLCDLPTALEAISQVGREDVRLLLDTMHLFRSGGSVEEVAALPASLIDYIQVSDSNFKPRFESYFEESMFERMVPGEGELPLEALMAVLPKDRVYALEMPLREAARSGVNARDRLAPCVAAVKQMLAR